MAKTMLERLTTKERKTWEQVAKASDKITDMLNEGITDMNELRKIKEELYKALDIIEDQI